MKIEKMNDHQIRCTLTSEDLATRNIKFNVIKKWHLSFYIVDKENVVFFLRKRLLATEVKYHVFDSYTKV